MQNAGWEIKAAGWIALAILGALVLYLIIQKLQDPSGKT
jgi:hypothetical protein